MGPYSTTTSLWVAGIFILLLLLLLLTAARALRWRRLLRRAHESEFGDSDQLSSEWNRVPARQFAWYAALLAPEDLSRCLKELAASVRWGGIISLSRSPELRSIGDWIAEQLRNPHSVHSTGNRELLTVAIDVDFVHGTAMDIPLLPWQQNGYLTEKSLVEPVEIRLDMNMDTMDIDIADAVFPSVMSVVHQFTAVQEGNKTVPQAVADGAVDVGTSVVGIGVGRYAASYVGGYGLVVVGVAVGTREILRQVVKFGRRHELKKRYKTNAKALRDLGAAINQPEYLDVLRSLIDEGRRQQRQAVDRVAEEVSAHRRSLTYWIWPSAEHAFWAVTLEQGQRTEEFAADDVRIMNAHLESIQQSKRRDELLGLLVMRNQAFKDRVPVDAGLLLSVEAAGEAVREEKERLRLRYGI